MIPIAKNIIVIDEQGNKYESTYPKRAKGLIKNGRARFIDEKTICLVTLPHNMEDNNMSDNVNNELNNEVNETLVVPVSPVSEQLVTQILEQVTKINDQTQHLNKAFQAIAEISGSDYAVEQSEAMVEMVREREETNRKALSLLESMLDNKLANPKMRVIDRLSTNNISGANTELIRELLQEI